MTLAELKTQLATTGYPVAYDHFASAQDMPYITYRETRSKNFSADNKMYQKVTEVQITLYTSTKDLVAEAALENAISSFAWDKTYEFDSDELQHINYYSIQLI